MKLETLLFGDYSKREIKKIKPIADAVEALADKYRAMSEDELRGISTVLRARLEAGETLNDILPDAFAAVRETADRILGKRPFYVQILGGILLHQGRISEMKTGEGKTLVATMPAYLNALTGNGVHVVTVNDYLAKRDAAEMGRVYEYLGLRTGVVYGDMEFGKKRSSYACDITYGTSNEFGFDYLRDNIAKKVEYTLQRGHNFCIIDEVDSILIDEARNPLIISGEGNNTSDIYEKCDAIVRKMTKKVVEEMDDKAELDEETVDYIVDEKSRHSVLTPRGADKVERHFGIDNLNDTENTVVLHNINMAIQAWGVMQRDVDYIVDNGTVIIVDQNTGRLMPGRRFQDGLHQAIEAKERVKVKGESHVVATITLQNYFRMYKKLSGMTGTAKTEEEEFRQVYGLDVVEVPTNKPMIRTDKPDRFFLTEDQKFAAIVKQVIECHKNGQPVLIGTASVEKSEKLAKFLKAEGLKFRLLNAKVNAKEYERDATSASAAGRPGEIIVATNMAGRGTDIMLGGNAEFQAKEWIRNLIKKEQKDIKGNRKASEGFNRISGYFNSIAGNEEEWVARVASNTPVDQFFTRYNESDRKMLQKKLAEHRSEYKLKYEQFKNIFETDRKMVIEAGGLCIIGSERHESRRIDNQLRGRAGRQGDPGTSTFYVSMEDDIIRLFGDNRVEPFKKMMSGLVDDADAGELMQNMKMFSDVMEKAQKNVEAKHFKARKNVLQYDDILNEQRKQIFSLREEILRDGDISEKIIHMIGSTVEDSVDEYTYVPQGAKYPVVDVKGLSDKYAFCQVSENDLESKKPNEIAAFITERAVSLYHGREEACKKLFTMQNEAVCEALCGEMCDEKCESYSERLCEKQCEKLCNSLGRGICKQLCEKLCESTCESAIDCSCEVLSKKMCEIPRKELCEVLGGILGSNRIRNFERQILLNNMDELWLDHIDAIDALKESIGLQAYAQKDPLKEYKIIGSSMFADLINNIRQNTVRMVLTNRIEILEMSESAAKNLRIGNTNGRARGQVRRVEKVGPNDPCPCGSGKKYKKCCGAGGGN